MLTRSVIAALMIVSAGLYAQDASAPERTPVRAPLAAAPAAFGTWRAEPAPPLADDVVAQLGVDDYINRRYVADGAAPVSLYVGYYASQRQGDTIHSPQNCLPGAGWQPIFSDRAQIHAGGGSIPVNRFIIQKGMDRQAVFYWYQGRGRVIANEYANKAWLMLDAARLRRTDGGLVRLMTAVETTPEAAFSALATFSAALFPHLPTHLP